MAFRKRPISELDGSFCTPNRNTFYANPSQVGPAGLGGELEVSASMKSSEELSRQSQNKAGRASSSQPSRVIAIPRLLLVSRLEVRVWRGRSGRIGRVVLITGARGAVVNRNKAEFLLVTVVQAVLEAAGSEGVVAVLAERGLGVGQHFVGAVIRGLARGRAGGLSQGGGDSVGGGGADGDGVGAIGYGQGFGGGGRHHLGHDGSHVRRNGGFGAGDRG